MNLNNNMENTQLRKSDNSRNMNDNMADHNNMNNQMANRMKNTLRKQSTTVDQNTRQAIRYNNTSNNRMHVAIREPFAMIPLHTTNNLMPLPIPKEPLLVRNNPCQPFTRQRRWPGAENGTIYHPPIQNRNLMPPAMRIRTSHSDLTAPRPYQSLQHQAFPSSLRSVPQTHSRKALPHRVGGKTPTGSGATSNTSNDLKTKLIISQKNHPIDVDPQQPPQNRVAQKNTTTVSLKPPPGKIVPPRYDSKTRMPALDRTRTSNLQDRYKTPKVKKSRGESVSVVKAMSSVARKRHANQVSHDDNLTNEQPAQQKKARKNYSLDEKEICVLAQVFLKSKQSIKAVIQSEGYWKQKTQVYSIVNDLKVKEARENGITSICHPVMKENLKVFFQKRDEKEKEDKRRDGNAVFLTKHEEKLVVSLVRSLNQICASCTKDDVRHWVEMIYFARVPANLQFPISDEVVDRLFATYNLKLYRGRGIEPARAKQANRKVQLAFFAYLDHYCHAMHAADPAAFPFASFGDIPADLLFNMDEMASNPAHICHNTVVAKDILESLNRNCYVITPEGNKKVNLHVSLALTTCAAGTYCVPCEGREGAPGPFFVITDQTKTVTAGVAERMETLEQMDEADKIQINPNIYQGFQENFSGFDSPSARINNDYAMCIESAANGSMTLETMYTWALHFTRFLPANIGRGEGLLPAILFLDGHTSRWNPKALEHLYNHNVHVIFLPSKTSIWSQPNDNGINFLCHKHIDSVAKEMRMGKTSVNERVEHPFILVRAWKRVIESEYLDLQGSSISNKATQGFDKTGLHPFRTKNKMWEEWIERVRTVQQGLETTFGAEEQEYLVPKLRGQTLLLTNQEKELLDASSQFRTSTPSYTELLWVQANILLNRHHPQRSANLRYEIIEELNIPLFYLSQVVRKDIQEAPVQIDLQRIRLAIESFLDTKSRLDKARNTIQPTNQLENLVCEKIEFVFPKEEVLSTIENQPISYEEKTRAKNLQRLRNTKVFNSVHVHRRADDNEETYKTFSALRLESHWRITTASGDIFLSTEDLASDTCEFVLTEENHLPGTRSYNQIRKDRKKRVRHIVADRKQAIKDAQEKAKEELDEEDRERIRKFAAAEDFSDKAIENLRLSLRNQQSKTIMVPCPNIEGHNIQVPFSLTYGETGFFDNVILKKLMTSVVSQNDASNKRPKKFQFKKSKHLSTQRNGDGASQLAAIREHMQMASTKTIVSHKEALKKVTDKIKTVETILDNDRSFAQKNPTKHLLIDSCTPISRIKLLLKLLPIEPDEAKQVTTQSVNEKAMNNKEKRAAMSQRMILLMREKCFEEDVLIPGVDRRASFYMDDDWFAAQLTLFKQNNQLHLLEREKREIEMEIKNSQQQQEAREEVAPEEVDEENRDTNSVASEEVNDENLDTGSEDGLV